MFKHETANLKSPREDLGAGKFSLEGVLFALFEVFF